MEGPVLHEFIEQNHAEIVRRCRQKAAARPEARQSADVFENGVPLFLEELSDILRRRTESSPQIRESAVRHGDEMFRVGFTVGQVVHGYGDVCQAITELALEHDLAISTADFRTLNACLDDAIANAVTEFARRRDVKVSADGTERLAILAHELRNLLNSATLSFEVLSTGRVGVGGASGAILARSLSGLRDLVNRSLAEGRITALVQKPERISVAGFIEELQGSAALDARARNVRFTVVCDDQSAAVEADRQVLGSAVTNLLQNAFKFSRSGGHVRLRTSALADRVRIEVEDECGGLPPGDPKDLFLPYEQRGLDRSGLGLGLPVSQRGVETSGGEILVRDIPGKGCVFTVDLPRAAVRALVAEIPA
jgi:signal transduction histidine kinase